MTTHGTSTSIRATTTRTTTVAATGRQFVPSKDTSNNELSEHIQLVNSLMKTLFYIYGTMSLVTLIAYAIDKRAAVRGKWRIPESYLHALELGCGWPGAWLAQRLFRHKSSKKSYQVVYWFMVALNLGALWYLRDKWM